MYRLHHLLLVLFVGLPTLGAAGEPCQSGDLRLLTGPTTGYYYRLGKAIQKAAFRRGLHVCAVPADNTLDNVVSLNDGTAAFAIAQSDVAHDAWHGHGGRFPAKLRNVKLVMPLYIEAVHILLRPHLYISGLSGLQRKKVWMGAENSATQYTMARVLSAAGIEVQGEDKLAGEHKISNFCDAVKHLRTMDLDAVFRVTRYPSPDVQDALDSKPDHGAESGADCAGGPEVELLALDYDVVRRLVSDGSYAETLIPRSAYGRDSSTLTIGVQALLLSGKGTRDADVKEMANLLRENREAIQQEMAASVQREHQHHHENSVPQLSLMDVEISPAQRFFVHPQAQEYLYQWWRNSWKPLLRFTVIFCIIIWLLVWHRHHVRRTVRRQPRIAFAAIGMFLIWCFGSTALFYLEGNVNEYFSSFPRSLESMICYSSSIPGYDLVTPHGHLAGQITRWLSLVLLGGLITPLAKETVERISARVLEWLNREHPVALRAEPEEKIADEELLATGTD